MRQAHRHSPFHCIECWTGFYFRRAALWEVGTYILVEHHTKPSICDGLHFQAEFLERGEKTKDQNEQVMIAKLFGVSGSASASATGSDSRMPDYVDGIVENDETYENWQENSYDANFLHSGDRHHRNGAEDSDDESDVEATDNGSGKNAEADVEGFIPYLGAPNATDAGRHPDADAGADADAEGFNIHIDCAEPARPAADALNNTYVRIVHTNGIHHLAMMTCLCQGEHNVPLDLVASRLLPASFTRIRTQFTTPLRDYYRLCNLELKASAYQFYQLICRMTRPVGNAEIVNLYHEFRRMSRLWRWMKKLKWAGYGHNHQDPLHPVPGSLANYCPTCPQPGINLPDDWKSDRNRFVMFLNP